MSESKLGPRRLILGALAVLALVAAGSWIYVTFLQSEESKVRRALAEVRAAADERNPRAISDMLTEDFSVNWGRRGADKNDVHNALIRLLMADYKFGFDIRFAPADFPVEVSEDETTATAHFKVFAKGQATKDGPWIALSNREASGKVTFVTTLAKTEDGWKLKRILFERK